MVPVFARLPVCGAAGVLFPPGKFASCFIPVTFGRNSTGFQSAHQYHALPKEEDYSKYYKTLNLSKDCDQEQLRHAFLELVKQFHPDSGSPDADANKFLQIEAAYRKLQDKFTRERWKASEGEGEYGLYYEEKKEEIFDIKHTAPQHRQYLSYDGIGTGTPQQREKQYQKYRALKAAENIYEHRVSKLAAQHEDSLLVKDKREAKKVKTRYGMDRLVEDLIQESMARGEFDNLSGKGKPLPYQISNPYVDTVTHKINQILIENGFTPEWITLQKEIREEIDSVCNDLAMERSRFGIMPLPRDEQDSWETVLKEYEERIKQLNSKITKYNLVVPLMKKQMVMFKLDKEAEKILQKGKTKYQVESQACTTCRSVKDKPTAKDGNKEGLLVLLGSFWPQ